MATAALINIGPSERAWASPPNPRSWQNFWGTFEREPRTGLYIAHASDLVQKANLIKAFLKLPKELQEACLEWRVTFSFADTFTASGNASTFYGDFSRRNRKDVSPHIEMGQLSLTEHFILPHLTHELCHLFWRTRSEQEKEEYRQFLKESCTKQTVEVTPYLQDIYRAHLDELKYRSEQIHPFTHKSFAFERWVEESFCETTALLVDPDYPSASSTTNVDLVTRKIVIALTFGLFSQVAA